MVGGQIIQIPSQTASFEWLRTQIVRYVLQTREVFTVNLWDAPIISTRLRFSLHYRYPCGTMGIWSIQTIAARNSSAGYKPSWDKDNNNCVRNFSLELYKPWLARLQHATCVRIICYFHALYHAPLGLSNQHGHVCAYCHWQVWYFDGWLLPSSLFSLSQLRPALGRMR